MIFISFTLASFLSHEALGACLDAKRVTQEITSSIELLSPENKPLQPDLCNESSTAFHTLRALLFLRDIPAESLGVSEFNPGLIGSSPFNYFKSRVKKLVLDEAPKSESCPDQRLAFVSPFSREEKKIWICSNSIHFDLVTLSSALMHESRHLDGAEFAHKPCLIGPYKDQFSCDDKYQDGGAYAIGLEFLVRLAKNSQLDHQLRERARQAAIVDFSQRFNTLPLDLQSGALLRKEGSDELSFYNGKTVHSLPFKIANEVVLALQAGVALFYSPLQGDVKQFSFRQDLVPARNDALVEHFRKLPGEKQKKLLDVGYGKQLACLLLNDSLECFDREKLAFTKSLNALRPTRFLTSMDSRVLEPGVLFFFDESRTLYRIPPSAEEVRAQDPESWKQPASELVGLARWPGGEIALGLDGQISLLSYRTRRWTPAEGPTKDDRYRQLLAPFYWSTKLQDL